MNRWANERVLLLGERLGCFQVPCNAEHLIAQPEDETEIALAERLETAVIYTRQLPGKKFGSSFTIEFMQGPGLVVKINDFHYDPS